MKRNVLLLVLVLIIVVVLFKYNSSDAKVIDMYSEEATPIFHNNTINGLIYDIVINRGTNDNYLVIYPKIYDSIYHFKDINSIDKFDINIRIRNKSNNKYVIKSINYFNNKIFNYNDIIDSSISNNYYYVIGNEIINTRKTDMVKIVFEKK